MYEPQLARTLPRRVSLDRVVTVVTGCLVVALGLAVIGGWHAQSTLLVQLVPTLAPMQYNTAVGFVLCGIGLLASALGWPRLGMAGGTGAAALGGLTLIEHVFGVNLGIDLLLMQPFTTVQTFPPGRMGPNTALCFVLSGVTMLAMCTAARRAYPLFIPGVLGTTVLVIGLVAGIGHLNGVPTAYTWGHFSAMSVHTALGFVVLGTGILVAARGQYSSATVPTLWGPVLLGLGSAIVALSLWRILATQEHTVLTQLVSNTIVGVKTTLEEQVMAHLRPLERLASRWDIYQPSQAAWEADAGLSAQHDPSLQAIAWADASWHVRWLVPLVGNAGMQGQRLGTTERQQQALERAQSGATVTVARALDLAEGGKGLHVYVPVFQGGDTSGVMVGVFRVQTLLDMVLRDIAPGFALAVFDGDETIYGRDHTGRQDVPTWSREATVTLPGITWRVRIWPTPELLAAELSNLPELVLAAGLLMSTLLATIFLLAQVARRQTVQLAAHLRQMDSVHTVNTEITRELDLTTLLELILRRAVDLMPAAGAGAVYLWDETTQTLVPQVWQNVDWLHGVRFRLGEGLVGTAAQRRSGLLVPDYQASPYAQPRFVTHLGSAGVLAQSLVYRDRLVGVLTLNNRGTAQPFTTADQTLLTLLAAQAAIAIANAQLVADLQERTTTLAQTNAALHNEMRERQQAEAQVQRQQEALLQREKLAAMSTLLAGVAHELNNPLTIITMQADLLREEVGDENLEEELTAITRAAERCVRIVRNFLTLARQSPPQRALVHLNVVVEEAIELLSYALRVDNIDIALHLAEALPAIWADAHQLHQVVVNLVTNAQQALGETAAPRRVTLTTRCDPTLSRVVLEVADTGPGVPPEIQGRIFEPFFTTKPPGVGTGLGLSLCQGIIESHGGSITVESQPGQGTTFCIELPVGVAPMAVSEAPTPAALPAPAAQGKAILVVDDEASIGRAMTHLLRRDGYEVDTATNGHLALAKLQERRFDLILSDMRMPELDGPGLYREVASRAPHLLHRFIFLTGDTLGPEAEAFLKQIDAPRLLKPVRSAEVRRVVRQALQALEKGSYT